MQGGLPLPSLLAWYPSEARTWERIGGCWPVVQAPAHAGKRLPLGGSGVRLLPPGTGRECLGADARDDVALDPTAPDRHPVDDCVVAVFGIHRAVGEDEAAHVRNFGDRHVVDREAAPGFEQDAKLVVAPVGGGSGEVCGDVPLGVGREEAKGPLHVPSGVGIPGAADNRCWIHFSPYDEPRPPPEEAHEVEAGRLRERESRRVMA